MTAALAPVDPAEQPQTPPEIGETSEAENATTGSATELAEEPTAEAADEPTAEQTTPALADEAKNGSAVAPGFLSIYPTQDRLTPDQRASLIAIGIDPAYDPAQIRVFIHFCQVRRLDPYAKEAYLTKYGDKYSIITSIDTYRRKAFETGRYRRKVAVYWTGAADDPNSWVVDEKTRVRYRVWDDVWLRSEHPAAAKCVIEYYDEHGEIVQSYAVANWDMFVALKWKNNERVPNEMWTKGGPHQLGKCAEALALRQAFPTTLSGFYVQEEVEHLRSEGNAAYMENLIRRRRESMAQSQAATVDEGGRTVEGTIVGQPAESAPDTGSRIDAEQERTWLFEELGEQARILGQSRARLTTRLVAAHRCNAEDLPADALRPLVLSLRPGVAQAIEQRGGTDAASAYRDLPAAGHEAVGELLRAVPATAGDGGDGAAEQAG